MQQALALTLRIKIQRILKANTVVNDMTNKEGLLL